MTRKNTTSSFKQAQASVQQVLLVWVIIYPLWRSSGASVSDTCVPHLKNRRWLYHDLLLLQTVIGILQGLNNWQLHGGAPPSRVPPRLDSPEVQHGTFKKITRFFQKLDKTSSKSPFQVFHAFVFGYINIYFITKIHVEGGHWPRARRIFPPQILVSWRINDEPSVPSGEPQFHQVNQEIPSWFFLALHPAKFNIAPGNGCLED